MIITPGDINVTAAWSDFFFSNTVFNDIPYKPILVKIIHFHLFTSFNDRNIESK